MGGLGFRGEPIAGRGFPRIGGGPLHPFGGGPLIPRCMGPLGAGKPGRMKPPCEGPPPREETD